MGQVQQQLAAPGMPTLRCSQQHTKSTSSLNLSDSPEGNCGSLGSTR